jgi:hypothetical protein
MEIMDQNAAGMLWVKLIHRKNAQNSSESATLIPIRWTSKHRKLPPTGKFDEQMRSVHIDALPSNEHDLHGENLDGDLQKNAQSPIHEATTKHTTDAWKCEGAEQPNRLISSAPDSSAPAHSQTDGEEEDLCVVCMERAADFQLLPCLHDSFCRQCMVETICSWVRPEAPTCPLCRGAFHTMVLLD